MKELSWNAAQREFCIKTAPSYEWRQQMDFLRHYPPDCLYRYREGQLERAVDFGNFSWLITVRPARQGELVVRCLNGEPTQTERRQLAAFVSDWLDLKRDITPFYRIAEKDPLLGASVKKYRGLRIFALPDLFEALCWSIIGQQVNISFAYTLKNRFVETFGSFILWQEEKHWLFPLPALIAKLSLDDLTPLKLSRAKAGYLIGIAQAITQGELNKEALLHEADTSAMAKRLMQFKGVGQWTADYVLMKALLQPDAFPVGDAGVQNAVKTILGRSEKPSEKELREWALSWQGWEAYATLYLWRTLFAE
ncbi:DNA-3-methyladenine glycosylase [Azotosporobacter soli]|uniref:DNA-3-methyladenine glycosylase 2 n=1 Tax=Azotosporobacter soli TaxID=3055040 RepID=UPI0031FEFADE